MIKKVSGDGKVSRKINRMTPKPGPGKPVIATKRQGARGR
jgi:hypothetical protein